MAYYDGNIVTGEWDHVVCDTCAEAGAVPFELKPTTGWLLDPETQAKFPHGIPHQLPPWRWADWPVGKPCDKCGRAL